MEYAIDLARQSPPSPTKFCVGAVLVDLDRNEVISTGFSLELPDDDPNDPGTTHAEGCCFRKIARRYNLPEERIVEVLPNRTGLYITMEPCNERLSGKRTCVERILRLRGSVKKVYVGIPEPNTFIGQNLGWKRLEEAGVRVEVVPGLRDLIMKVSLSGHVT
jgi:pyrimidine deaminase RibD-like protein